VLQTPAPAALLLALGPDGLLMELGFSVGDPENGTQSVLSDVNRAVLASLKASGIEVTAPTREARRIGDPPFGAGQPV
jgi:small-conductance mechanosensitive channel